MNCYSILCGYICFDILVSAIDMCCLFYTFYIGPGARGSGGRKPTILCIPPFLCNEEVMGEKCVRIHVVLIMCELSQIHVMNRMLFRLDCLLCNFSQVTLNLKGPKFVLSVLVWDNM